MEHFHDVHHAVAHRNAGEHLSKRDDDLDDHVTIDEHLVKIANDTVIPVLGMDLRKAMNDLDENEDGKLSWWEFFQFSTPPPGHGGEHPPEHSAELEEKYMVSEKQHVNFKDFDQDDDGFVSPEELVAETIQVETQKFRAADADGNGLLNHNEVKGLLHPATHDGVLKVVVKLALDKKDDNKDGVLSAEEMWNLDEGESMSRDEKSVWESLDLNADNVIDEEEFVVWESGHWHAEDSLAEALKIADKDGDKFVTADEFVAAGQELATSFAMPYLAHWHEHHFDEL
jgi:Ca2+-binding EF-hand superfamily protein